MSGAPWLTLKDYQKIAVLAVAHADDKWDRVIVGTWAGMPNGVDPAIRNELIEARLLVADETSPSGMRLTRPPGKISLYDIVGRDIVISPFKPGMPRSEDKAPWDADEVLRGLEEELRARLMRVSLEELVGMRPASIPK